jgi:uncharacterized protein (TIGR02246 family)
MKAGDIHPPRKDGDPKAPCASRVELRAAADLSAAADLRSAANLTVEIRQVLERSMAAWNAGDLEGFLDCYEHSPQTIYLSSARIATGYPAIETMYADRFGASSPAVLGTLTMSLRQVTPLGSQHAFAVGRYLLNRDGVNGGSEHGVFSLVLRKTPLGWRIAADHTSA